MIKQYKPSLIACIFGLVATLFCASAVASNSNTANTSVAHYTQSIWQSILGRTFSIKEGTRRLTFTQPNIKLENPRGFDVETEVHTQGTNSNSNGNLINLSLDNSLSDNGIVKRVWEIHFDNEDFDGLKLSTLTLGTGFAASPRQKWAWGGRIGGGVGAGLTFTDTFFDTAIHPSFDAWLTMGVQLKIITIDVIFRARKALSQTLDERAASPQTTMAGLSIGFVF